MLPKISALMSVYNGEEFIKHAIDSILSQTYQDFELIIVDDGSSDNSVEIIKSFDDHRIRLFRLSKNQGVGSALKFGLSKCRGQYIAKVDADDLNEKNRFEKQLKFLEENRNISLVGSFGRYFPNDEQTKNSHRYRYLTNVYQKQIRNITSSIELKEKIYWFCCIIHSTIMCRANVMKKISYDSKLRILEDYKFFYDLNKNDHSMYILPEELVKIRVTLTSTSVNEKENYFATNYYIKKNELHDFITEGNKKCIIYGASNYGEQFLERLEEDNLSNYIVGFSDSDQNKWGNRISGLYIYSPETLINQGYKVIVASTPGRIEISEFLARNGYRFMKEFFVF